MGNSPVLRVVGTEYNPEKEEELNTWHVVRHVPMILKGTATGNERYQRIGDDRNYPKHLALYYYPNEQALNDYLSSPLRKEVQQDVKDSWPDSGDLVPVWRISYKRIARRGDNDRSLAFVMIGTNCPRGTTEEEFNNWYTNGHMVLVLRNPLVIRAERYQRIEDDETCPKYLAIYRYPDEKTLLEGQNSFMAKLAGVDRRMAYPDSVWRLVWWVNYKLISKERKDLTV